MERTSFAGAQSLLRAALVAVLAAGCDPSHPPPKAVSGDGGSRGALNAVTAISAGSAHTCAVVNGGAQCWGQNKAGQLGNGSTADNHVPVLVTGLASGVQGIGAGGYHSCAVVNGAAWCWGDNDSGDLGNGSTTESNVPVAVSGLASGVTALAVGNPNHACALVNGGVQCWGYNFSGELGDGSSAASDVPVQVSGLTSGVEAIAAGYVDACALLTGGAQCWGNDSYGEVGNGEATENAISTPTPVLGLSGMVQAIATGGLHTCALVQGGVECWGYNYGGDLGNGSSYAALLQSLTPVQVSGLTGVQAITVGVYHACALSQDGGVLCWGDNSYGQLGAGAIASSSVPVAVQGLPGGAQAITAGDYHTCAMVDGAAWCWGDNANGDLGNGSTTQSNVPVPVSAAGSPGGTSPAPTCPSASGPSCPGAVTVAQGLLAGGDAGEAMAASAFYSIGPRVVLAGCGCALLTETSSSSDEVAEASLIRLNLPAGIGPGTYQFTPDGGAPFEVTYVFTSPYYGGDISGPVSGTVTLTLVDPTQGVQGSYYLDFGGAGISGGTSGPGGTTYGSLGELIEEGTFVAPVCALCALEPDAGAPPALGDAGLAACDAYYAALITGCSGPVLPAAENARQLTRFEQVCENEAALPGSGVTAASLAACASAFDCDLAAGPPPACYFSGSLPADTACTDGIQCQSGDCAGTEILTPEGPFGPATCGTCAPGAATPADAGAACSNPAPNCVVTADGGACQYNAECALGLGCVSGTCAPVSWVSAGQPCGASVYCLVGDCDYGGFGPPLPGPDGGPPVGNCPTVIPDGQPCTNEPGASSTCDAYAECFEGNCVLTDAVACQ